MNILKIKTKILLVALLFFCGMEVSTVFAFDAYGLNTLAGNSTVLRTSAMAPNTDVVFVVKRPNGSMFNLPARTNQNGVALKELSDYYTREAGKYGVAVKSGTSSSSGFNHFYVYPNKVSAEKSYFGPENQVVNSVGGRARLKVRLADDYNNPVPGHTVRVISSSRGNTINSLTDSNKTNGFGEIEFEVSSGRPEKVTYSAYDANSDVTLESKVRVVYLGEDRGVSGNSLFASVLGDVGNSSGSVDSLEFLNVPQDIEKGEDISLTVSAHDYQGQKVIDYTGEVRFSVIGDNSMYAELPSDYRFVTENRGEHTFSLSFSFLNEGVYKLEVVDLENPTIKGEVELIVSSDGPIVPDDDIIIANPASGGVYSNNIQVVSGAAPANANLAVFDNDVKIGNVSADSTGNFSFTTGRLADGEHEIYVASVNEIGTILETSSVVNFSINTSPADISDIIVEPSGEIGAGEIIKIQIVPTETLGEAKILIDGNEYVLRENAVGNYEVSIPAPIEFGEYVVSVILVDELGNESTFRDAHVLRVGPSSPSEPEGIGPVLDLKATPEESRVVLEWSEPTKGAGRIVHYRVFYGPSPNELTDAVDTFTDATMWYIPNLVNGELYYFAVAGVDAQGGMSESFDTIVYSTPTPAVVDKPSLKDEIGTGGADALDDMEKDVSDSGPEILWLVLLSALGGAFYSGTRKSEEVF